jgi:DMSO/TMAO reductase YedYZ molybdopterin-dependent catalytic subunit
VKESPNRVGALPSRRLIDHRQVEQARRQAMAPTPISRRTLLRQGGAALGGLGALRLAGPAGAFPGAQDATVVRWLDQPEPNPVPEAIVRQLDWEELDSWITPNDQFFVIKHFHEPRLDEADWRLQVGGLVERPLTLTLDDLKARPRREATVTPECSGNSAFPFNKGLVGNATWAGAPLAPLLEEAGVRGDGPEVVFWGADAGE